MHGYMHHICISDPPHRDKIQAPNFSPEARISLFDLDYGWLDTIIKRKKERKVLVEWKPASEHHDEEAPRSLAAHFHRRFVD